MDRYHSDITVTAKSILRQPFQDDTLKVIGIPTKSLKRKRSQNDPETIIQFLCQGPDVLGTFLPEKAKELGIPRGPLYGKLQKGNSVTLEDGRVIEPHQVVTKGRPGAVSALNPLNDRNS
jgi:ribonuclease BN (tRNA processing enzyme)